MPQEMAFEPVLPAEFATYFRGNISAHVSDSEGVPAGTIISLEDRWYLTVHWDLAGTIVGSIGGTWYLSACLESIGPGPEMVVAQAEIPMTGVTHYMKTLRIDPKQLPDKLIKKIEPGVYTLAVVLTSTNLRNRPAPFAGYVQGDILQFFQGEDIADV